MPNFFNYKETEKELMSSSQYTSGSLIYSTNIQE